MDIYMFIMYPYICIYVFVYLYVYLFRYILIFMNKKPVFVYVLTTATKQKTQSLFDKFWYSFTILCLHISMHTYIHDIHTYLHTCIHIHYLL